MFIQNGVRTDNPLVGNDILLINKTGAASVKGTVVTASSSVDNACSKVQIDIPNPIGVIAEDDVPDGIAVRVITGGIGDVLFVGNTTRGHLARTCVTADSNATQGQAISEAIPTSPFATDKHFMEIGHVLESRTGAGLAKCLLHFN